MCSICERPAGVHHGPPDVVSAGVADGDDAPVAVAVPFLASDLGAGDGVRELGLGDGAASDGAVGPLARLVHFGRVDAVKADALAGNLDSVAVDYARGACYFTERQDRPQDDRHGDQ